MDRELISRLINWAKGIPQGPYIIDLNPTNRCNLNCRSCWIRGMEQIDYSSEVPLSRLMEIIYQGKELKVRKWMITGGGEPTFYREKSFSLMLKIKELGMEGEITTNCTLFDEKIIEKLVRAGWDKIVISIDGPDAKTNDYLRGKSGTFDKIIQTLHSICRWKSRLHSDKPLLQFNTVLSNQNYNKMKEMIELAAQFGVGIVAFEPITIHSDLGKELKLTAEQQAELPHYALEAQKRASELGIWTNAINYLDQSLVEQSNQMDQLILKTAVRPAGFCDLPCFEPWYHLVIKTDGSVGPCCIFDSPDALNIKYVSLKQAWLNGHIEVVRKTISHGKLMPYCSICNAGQLIQNRNIAEILKSSLSITNKPLNP